MSGEYYIQNLKEYIQGAIPKYKTIDGAIERLNRRTVTTVFVVFFFLTLQDDLTGRPIECHGFELFDSSSDFVNDYCWTQGLFTNKLAYNLPRYSLPAPGIAPCILNISDGEFFGGCNDGPDQIAYHRWYQFVSFYFLLSALAYWLPHIIMKVSIFGSLSNICDVLEDSDSWFSRDYDLNAPVHMGSMLSTWVRCKLRSRYEESILTRYKIPILIVSMKISYLIASVVHFVLTGMMFPHGNYYMMGILWSRHKRNDTDTHIKDVLFPKMAGCIIKKWGVTGLVQDSGMCTLAANVINQYMFCVTWWLCVVTIGLNVLNIFGFSVKLFFNAVYFKKLGISYERRKEGELENDLYSGIRKEEMKVIFAYYDIGGQIILQTLADNVHPAIFVFGMKKLFADIDKECRQNPNLKEEVKTRIKPAKNRDSSVYTQL